MKALLTPHGTLTLWEEGMEGGFGEEKLEVGRKHKERYEGGSVFDM